MGGWQWQKCSYIYIYDKIDWKLVDSFKLVWRIRSDLNSINPNYDYEIQSNQTFETCDIKEREKKIGE